MSEPTEGEWLTGNYRDAEADYDEDYKWPHEDYKWPHEMTREELLAEMPTEALVEELRRRGFQAHVESGGWSTVVVDSESWQEYVEGLKAIDD